MNDPAPSPAGIELIALTKQYAAGSVAVDSINLRIASGSYCCLLGPSGCGKSTTLRMIAGHESTTSGDILLENRNITHLPAAGRGTAMMFQSFALFPHLSALDNVAFSLKMKGVDKTTRHRQAQDLLERVAMGHLSARKPGELSGGQQQRVALARAFARRPRAMLLDEPFASIDAVLRRKLRNDVRAILKDHGAATILVTHDPEEALALGDRIAIMDRGRIIEVASPRALFDTPKTAAGASLFAGSQALTGKRRGDEVVTAFGSTLAQGGPEGDTLVVVQPGGAEMIADPDGNAVVEDCRFVGPHWTVALAAGDPRVFLTVSAPEPVEPGARFSVRFNPSRVKVFEADEGRIDAGEPAA